MSSGRVTSAPSAFLVLPQLSSVPIPAASTVGIAVIYNDASLGVLISVNGGAYTPLQGTSLGLVVATAQNLNML